MTDAQEFAEFATAISARLRRTAFMLCGDWYAAEDLVQITLAKVFVSWRRISRRDAAPAYATRTLVNVYLADKRLKRPHEILTDRLPERQIEPPAPELRMVVLEALAALPRGGRTVLVLRYWEDMTVELVAAVLGCSQGNVKSQAARALSRLRESLGDELTGSVPHGRLLTAAHEPGERNNG